MKKLKRETTRGDLDRLILSVERMDFEDNHCAVWTDVIFENGEGKITYDRYGEKAIKTWKISPFQKKILDTNDDFEGRNIRRSELKEENGQWYLDPHLCKRMISSGGEAIVLKEQFEQLEAAVRVQLFDPAIFTKNNNMLDFKIHLSKGKKIILFHRDEF